MCPIVLCLFSLLLGAQTKEVKSESKLEAEARGMAMLQHRLMLELVQRHKQMPRLTYFTCRNPANNDTGNVRANRANLQQLRVAFDAKNLQLIESLYASSGAFVRIVHLDVLSQGKSKSKTGGKGRAGQSNRGRGGGVGGATGGGSGNSVTAFNS